MLSRRGFLQLGSSLATCSPVSFIQRGGRFQIVSEPNCLSEESAAGFRSLFVKLQNVIVLCGVASISLERALILRQQVMSGGSILWESSPFCAGDQRQILREVFGIRVGEPMMLSQDHLYVCYCWPGTAFTRAFSTVLPINCPHREVIATYRGTPVGMRRRMGRGNLIFAGSMLGPNLRAEEREAADIAGRMLNFQE